MQNSMRSAGTDRAQLVRVTDGLIFRQAVDNMGWADLGGSTLIVDALEDSGQGQAVTEDINRTMPGQPAGTVFNTHTHGDHIALNHFFAEHFGSIIVNRRQTDIPENGYEVEGQRRRAYLIPVTPCHSSADAVVWFPDDKVLFTGDLFGWGMIPRVGGVDSDYLDRLCSLYAALLEYGPHSVLPGHGPPAGPDHIQRCIGYLQWLRRNLALGAFSGLNVEQALRQFPPPADMRDWHRFTDWKHAHNIKALAGHLST